MLLSCCCDNANLEHFSVLCVDRYCSEARYCGLGHKQKSIGPPSPLSSSNGSSSNKRLSSSSTTSSSLSSLQNDGEYGYNSQ